MNLLGEIWKFATAAWAQLAKTFTCFFLKIRLEWINTQIEGSRMYINNVKDDSTNFTKSFARYLEGKLPEWLGEREELEAQLEINGCKEN